LEGTTVGGLSSITFDPQRDVFYAVSDDPSQLQPARFYTVALELSDGRLADGDVRFEDVTTLLAPDGRPYAPFSLDPEGLALTKDRELILTSEGFANSLIDPFVRRYSLTGSFLGSLPVPQPFRRPASQFSVNGLVELLPLNNEFLIAMERSFSVGAPATGNTIKLYEVALPGATDVNGVDSLAGQLDGIRPAQKTLLLDLDELGIPLDNVEGLTFGPRLPDGRRPVVLVSDNNFAASQFTQFLLFALER
jgi:hypothetical protein